MARWGRRVSGALASVLLLMGFALTASMAGQEAADRGAPANSIQVVVNGVVTKTWTADQLMRRRFDWANAKGKFRPAVALTEVLSIKDAGFTLDSLTELKVLSRRESVTLRGEALTRVKDLVLQIEVDKGGTWKLAPRNREAEGALRKLVGPRIAVEGVRRVEVVTGPAPGTKN